MRNDSGKELIKDLTMEDTNADEIVHLDDKIPVSKTPIEPRLLETVKPDPITGFRTVRIFISSTFRDMHGERDYLARFVLPEINERVRHLRVRVLFIDLRWGLVKGGNALIASLVAAEQCKVT